MSTIALAVCMISIVGLWGLGKYVQVRRSERARNAWMDRQAARAVEEARAGAWTTSPRQAAQRPGWVDGHLRTAMSQERRRREPRQTAVALHLAQTVRGALADGIEQHREIGCDSEVLLHEIVRTLGTLVRLVDLPPSKLEELIEFFRRVYAGLAPGSAPPVEEVLSQFGPESGWRGLPSADSEHDLLQSSHGAGPRRPGHDR